VGRRVAAVYGADYADDEIHSDEVLMSVYDPLLNYLKRQSLKEIILTFSDIERLLGRKLPKSAQRPQWWANEISPNTRLAPIVAIHKEKRGEKLAIVRFLFWVQTR
jgi:hypothetical protein